MRNKEPEASLFMFNFDTNEFDIVDGKIGNPEPYIPKIARSLYQCYVESGKDPMDAAVAVLQFVVGEETSEKE